jgi:NADPH-dependent 2,4-dienoyl-CoA reductase/sulfur reductase-like enzyme
VWAIEPLRARERGHQVAYSLGRTSGLLRARHILLATGAQERPFPIPGWTLPGVLTAGAAQILLKSAAVAPSGRTILAGCGPLLYLLAWQYLNAGVKVDALLDTTPQRQMAQALPYAWDFLRSAYFGKGLKLLRAVQRSIPIIRGVTRIEAQGTGKLERVTFASKAKEHSLAADQLLLHQGVVPNVNLSQAVGVPNRWNELCACWEPAVDVWGATALANLSIAGDGAGIGGARAAEHRGRLAALHAASVLGRIEQTERDRSAAKYREELQRALRGRRFFDTLYQAPDVFRRPSGDTIVCRCEEVTAEQVRQTARLGCQGPNQMKAFLRCGMGPCQGRFCSLTVTELIAAESGRAPAEVGHYRLRYPTKPITVGELASLPQTDASRRAVIRFTSIS